LAIEWNGILLHGLPESGRPTSRVRSQASGLNLMHVSTATWSARCRGLGPEHQGPAAAAASQ
jgi:hypothetical protein